MCVFMLSVTELQWLETRKEKSQRTDVVLLPTNRRVLQPYHTSGGALICILIYITTWTYFDRACLPIVKAGWCLFQDPFISRNIGQSCLNVTSTLAQHSRSFAPHDHASCVTGFESGVRTVRNACSTT